MQSSPRLLTVIAVASIVARASAQENYESWEILQSTFESTGGGGIMIKEYRPVIVGNKCVTDFTATEPSGKIYYNTVEFEAVQVQGGTLCTNGAWRAFDGRLSGTTRCGYSSKTAWPVAPPERHPLAAAVDRTAREATLRQPWR